MNQYKNGKISNNIFFSIISIVIIAIGWLFTQMNNLSEKTDSYQKDQVEIRVLLASIQSDLVWIKASMTTVQNDIVKIGIIK